MLSLIRSLTPFRGWGIRIIYIALAITALFRQDKGVCGIKDVTPGPSPSSARRPQSKL